MNEIIAKSSSPSLLLTAAKIGVTNDIVIGREERQGTDAIALNPSLRMPSSCTMESVCKVGVRSKEMSTWVDVTSGL